MGTATKHFTVSFEDSFHGDGELSFSISPDDTLQTIFDSIKTGVRKYASECSDWSFYPKLENASDKDKNAFMDAVHDTHKKMLSGDLEFDGEDSHPVYFYLAHSCLEKLPYKGENLTDYIHDNMISEEIITDAIIEYLGDGECEEALARAGLSADELARYIDMKADDALLMHAMEDGVIDADNFTANDFVNQFSDISMVYTPNDNPSESEDNWVTMQSACDAASIVPDEAFEDLLRLANMPAQSYIAGIRELNGTDLCDGEDGESWDALKDRSPSDYGVDTSLPAVISPKGLISVLENVSGEYGTPFIGFKMNSKDIVEKLLNKDHVLEIDQGGIIGLHNGSSGYGDFDYTEGKVVIKGGIDSLTTADGDNSMFGYGIVDTHDIGEDAFKCRMTVRSPENSPQSEFSIM